MARTPDPGDEKRLADAERGRTASAGELRDRLGAAPPAYLEGAIENPALGVEELLRLLRNRSAPPTLLARIARDRKLAIEHEVKLALVVHPRTPQPLARTLAAHLRLMELVEVAADPKVVPPVRRKAEDLLRIRLEDAAVGERVAIARRASRGLIAALHGDREARVLRALLGNPRLVEADAASLAASISAPGEALAALAEHATWGARRSVRWALARNPRAPARAALRAVRGLSRADLARLAADEDAPALVRIAAERRLASPERDIPDNEG